MINIREEFGDKYKYVPKKKNVDPETPEEEPEEEHEKIREVIVPVMMLCDMIILLCLLYM